ncbi:hypothetical protein FX016_23035 [Cupriavidus gilardii]|nr:hypothetical protein FX016_23035 [Cupriavidus gilardii]
MLQTFRFTFAMALFVAVNVPASATEPTVDAVDLVALRTSAAAPLQSTPPQQRWEITRDDPSLAVGLRRWAEQAGYERFVWSPKKELPRTPLTVSGTFVEAMEQIMRDSEAAAYPVRTCIYLNKTVRVVYATQPCKPR